MSVSLVRQELFKRVNELVDEIREGMKYGIPHLVGEITGGDVPKVELNVAVFNGSNHKFILTDEKALLFMLPVDSPNPRRIFLDLWMFLNGKSSESELEPGTRFRGVLKNALKRAGFEVIWMNVQEDNFGGYVDVLTVKEGERYRMTFEKKGDEFTLLEAEKI